MKGFLFLVPQVEKKNTFTDSILQNCMWLGKHVLNDDDKKQINALYPEFSFNHLSEYELQKNGSVRWGQDDVTLFPRTQYHKFGLIKKNDFMIFEVSNKKYKDWLNTDWGIFFNLSILDISETSVKCEELFDTNVLEIKILVSDIGDLKATVAKKQLNLVLYDDSNILNQHMHNGLTNIFKYMVLYRSHIKE